jgi:hypothetical protein
MPLTFKGLNRYFDGLLDSISLALTEGVGDIGKLSVMVGRTAERFQYGLAQRGAEQIDLTESSRAALAWFLYFSKPEAFERYVAATRCMHAALMSEAAPILSWRGPVIVHFRPARQMYRWRISGDGTRIVLPTPTLALEPELMVKFARQVAGARIYRPEVTAGLLGEPYQTLKRELDGLAAEPEQPQGAAHDLLASFDRVNRAYFGGTMARPRLVWGNVITGRKFGHYDFIQDTVMISRTLDRPEIPEFVIDHVMHHELLHKKHGFRWSGRRRCAHTPEFRSEERQFPQYSEADALLRNLAQKILPRRRRRAV